MAEYRAPFETYKAKVVEVTIGKGDRAIKIGGENVLAFNQTFDQGDFPNPPKIALEVWDKEPYGWTPGCLEPVKDVVEDPAAWAKRCVEALGAEAIFLYLISTDPNEDDTSPEVAAETAKKVYEACGVPLIVFGTGNEEKDPLILTKVAEALSGENLLLGPVLKEDYEPIANAAKEQGHCVVAQAPIDINLQKELDVKLMRILPPERIVLDPLAPALGYGLEYGFSIFERTKHVGVIFNDQTMQMPLIANFSFEVWRQKEPKENEEMGVYWELITAITYLEAGANLLVMRHPEVYKIIKEMIAEA